VMDIAGAEFFMLEDDLRALFTIKKQMLSHCHGEDCKILRTHLAMIRDVYRTRRQEDVIDTLTLPHYKKIDYYNDQNDWNR